MIPPSTHTQQRDVSFDKIDYSVPKQLYDAQLSTLQKQWVKTEAISVLEKSLRDCQLSQKASHLEACKFLAEKYIQMLQTSRNVGYLGLQRNDPNL